MFLFVFYLMTRRPPRTTRTDTLFPYTPLFRSPMYYRDGLRLLARLHRRVIVHNDLAKEPNWLVCADGRPALVDFQIAWTRGRRGRLFRLLAREDLRHMLKHRSAERRVRNGFVSTFRSRWSSYH